MGAPSGVFLGNVALGQSRSSGAAAGLDFLSGVRCLPLSRALAPWLSVPDAVRV